MSAPPNDDLANRAVMAFGELTEVSIADATLEGAELAIFDSGVSENSVWYEFTPDHDGVYGLDTFYSNDTGEMYWVCTGTGYGDLVIIHGPLSGSGGTSYDLVGGTTYLIRIARSTGTTGVDIVTFQMREYRWTDWTDQPEQTVGTTTMLGYKAYYDAPETDSDEFEKGVDFNNHVNIRVAEIQTDLEGLHPSDDDSWFLDATINNGGGTDYIGEDFWRIQALIGNNGDIVFFRWVLNARGYHSPSTAWARPAFVPAVYDQPSVRFESTEYQVLSANLVFHYAAWRDASHPDKLDSWPGDYDIAMYLPATSPSMAGPDSVRSVVVDRAALPDLSALIDDNGQIPVETVEIGVSGAQLADFKLGNDQIDGVIVWGRLYVTDPPIYHGYGTNTIMTTDYVANTSIDPSSSWVIKGPRFQLRELLDSGDVDPPRRMFPERGDGLGMGIGHTVPPPITRQAGRRSGPGAPY